MLSLLWLNNNFRWINADTYKFNCILQDTIENNRKKTLWYHYYTHDMTWLHMQILAFSTKMEKTEKNPRKINRFLVCFKYYLQSLEM